MKIIYDHQIYIQQEYGGISRYFYELSKGLIIEFNVDVKNTVRLSNNIYTEDPIYKSMKFFPGTNFTGRFRVLRLVNELSAKIELKQPFDVFHPTYYSTYFLDNIKHKPFVVTFYDLIHERFANKFEDLAEDKALFARRKLLLEKAAKVIAISQSTKNDIVEIYKIPAAKIDVVYLANSIAINSNITVPYDNYILYVGRRNAYKNFKPFIEAVAPLLLKEKGLKILCAGGDKFDLSEMNLFNELKITDQLVQLKINDEILSSLYQKALFFVFPSSYEGFGIPVLEAFACSCPALISNKSSLPEVGGDAALYFDPDDKEDMLDKVNKMLHSADLRNKLKVAGLQRQKLFTWTQTAKEHYEIYKTIL